MKQLFEIGDTIIATADLCMLSNKMRILTKGNSYEITGYDHMTNKVWITDDNGDRHSFGERFQELYMKHSIIEKIKLLLNDK